MTESVTLIPIQSSRSAIVAATAMRRIAAMKLSQMVKPVMKERVTAMLIALRVHAIPLVAALVHIVAMTSGSLNLRPAMMARSTQMHIR